MNHFNFFSEAVRLAESVKGLTSPNPAVGCVIVRQNRIIARGATRKTGCDHAETIALKKIGRRSKGATLYVTLEPCIDFPGKRTGSCTKAIIDAGIKTVWIGSRDPNPLVNGRGIAALRRAGVKVDILSEFTDKIQKLNEDFAKYVRTGVPFVTAKAAMTLDGHIATEDGDSQWISGTESRTWVHEFRNRIDGILVGIGTVLKDNPQLTVRMVKKKKNPLRFVLDPHGQTPSDSHVMSDGGRTVFITRRGVSDSFRRMCAASQQECLEFDPDPGGRIRLKEVLEMLGKDYGIESLMIEGGGRVFYHALQDRVIDKLIVCVAPKILGGRGMPLFNGPTDRRINDALTLRRISVETIGKDIFIEGYLETVWSSTENSSARGKFPSC